MSHSTTNQDGDWTLEPPEGLEGSVEKFFTTSSGEPTIAGRADLEEAVKRLDEHGDPEQFEAIDWYWVNKPYAFVAIYRSVSMDEKVYLVVEPTLTEDEEALVGFLKKKLQRSIDYSEQETDMSAHERAQRVNTEMLGLLKRYDLLTAKGIDPDEAGLVAQAADWATRMVLSRTAGGAEAAEEGETPIPRDPETNEVKTLSKAQVRKIRYYILRDYIKFGRIDPIKHDINIEDISCDGWDEPVFVYHTDHEQIITNVKFTKNELDDYIVKLAQNAGKGISKRMPAVDARLPDGSRAQLTLGEEISDPDKGSNFTIRQFKDVPFTPVDLINWGTFSLDQMVYIWLAIEHGMNIIIAGGTASGKTTTLNACSLFIPSEQKVVSIEDTRELEIPHRNWIASTTRESFHRGGTGDIDEFHLIENALRQRPDYVVMGEVRGKEGNDLFQLMQTGHTTYTTFHAQTHEEVIRRFVTDPINVPKSVFGSLDVILNQQQTYVDGNKVRRNTEITEVDGYDADSDKFRLSKIYEWDADTDQMIKIGDPSVLSRIAENKRGWSRRQLNEEILLRTLVLAYLIRNGINGYAEVAATIQAYMTNPGRVLSLMADGELRKHIGRLRAMRYINIDIDREKEALVPRPDPSTDLYQHVTQMLARNQDIIRNPEYHGASAREPVAELPEETPDPPKAPSDGDTDEKVAEEMEGYDEIEFDPGMAAGSGVYDGDESNVDDLGGDQDMPEGVDLDTSAPEHMDIDIDLEDLEIEGVDRRDFSDLIGNEGIAGIDAEEVDANEEDESEQDASDAMQNGDEEGSSGFNFDSVASDGDETDIGDGVEQDVPDDEEEDEEEDEGTFNTELDFGSSESEE